MQPDKRKKGPRQKTADYLSQYGKGHYPNFPVSPSKLGIPVRSKSKASKAAAFLRSGTSEWRKGQSASSRLSSDDDAQSNLSRSSRGSYGAGSTKLQGLRITQHQTDDRRQTKRRKKVGFLKEYSENRIEEDVEVDSLENHNNIRIA